MLRPNKQRCKIQLGIIVNGGVMIRCSNEQAAQPVAGRPRYAVAPAQSDDLNSQPELSAWRPLRTVLLSI